MHQIAFLVAMTATTGLFGGRSTQTCTSGTCYNSTPPAYSYAPAQVPGSYVRYYNAPQAVQAPAATYPAAPAAPARPAAAPARAAYYYYPGTTYYTPTASCPNGTCPRR